MSKSLQAPPPPPIRPILGGFESGASGANLERLNAYRAALASWEARHGASWRALQSHRDDLRDMLTHGVRLADWTERAKWKAIAVQPEPLTFLAMMLASGGVRDPRVSGGRPDETLKRQPYIDRVNALRADGLKLDDAIDAVAQTMDGDPKVMANRLREWRRPPRKRKRRE